MKNKVVRYLLIAMFPVLLFTMFDIGSGRMGTSSIRVIFSQSAIPTGIALTLAPIMLCGLMDYSAASRVILSATIGGVVSRYLGIPGMFLGCFVTGIVAALILGLVYKVLKVPSMVVSLGILQVYEILASEVARATGVSSSYFQIDPAVSWIGAWPYNIFIALFALVLFWFILYRTKTGCLLKAVGADEILVNSLGIDSLKIKLTAYLLSGIMCGFAAVLQLCYSSTLTILTGGTTMGTVFKPMMGVLIGRSLEQKLDNFSFLVGIGELSIIILFIGFVASGMSSDMQDIVLGVFLIVILGVTGNTDRLKEFKRQHDARKKIKAAA